MRATPWLCLLMACGTDDPQPPTAAADTGPGPQPPSPAAAWQLLEADDRAIRVSMALRGLRPTAAELDRVRADPAALDDLVDEWLDDPAMGDAMRDMWAELLQLRNDTFNQLPALGPLAGFSLDDIYQGTVEEPLALVEHVYVNDLPLTELVTADWMLTNDVTARIYGIPYDPAGPEWQMAAWPDARPRAGLLSSAQVFRRWESDGSNFNRGRANMLADVFLCASFAERDILVDGGIDIADEQQVAEAARNNPSCVSCHQGLDPLAGYFWGYKKLIHRNYVADSMNFGCEFDWSDGKVPEFGTSYLPEDYCYPIKQYSTADEDDWLDWDLREPSYYGTPARDLADVGRLVADDPRFAQCVARQTFAWLAQVERHEVPFEVAAELQGALVDSGYSPKALLKAAVLSDAFAAAAPLPGGASSPLAGMKVARPEQYARAVERLTGFRWWADPDLLNCDDRSHPDVQRFGTQCWEKVDLSDSDVFGYRAMAGGIDGKVVTRPTRTFTPTRTLVYAQLAANAAGFVVDADLALPASERRLLVDAERPTDQLIRLHAEILGEVVDADSDAIAADRLLLGDADADGWKRVLTAMLQDPRLLLH